MSQFISKLLSEEVVLKDFLLRLEDHCDNSGVDARLTSNIIISAKAKLKQLGLDPEDTRGEELYQSLINLASVHNDFLNQQLNITNNTDFTKKVGRLAEKLATQKKSLGIKHNIVKRTLSKNPPLKLAKTLGYRSSDSMLKRESLGDLIIGAQLVESEKWKTQYRSAFNRLKPSDLEYQAVKVTQLSSHKRWGAIIENKLGIGVVTVPELSSVVVLSLPTSYRSGQTILFLSLMLRAINEVYLYGSYFKFQQFSSQFGSSVSSALKDFPISNIKVAGQKLPWSAIYGHLNSDNNKEQYQQFIDSVQLDDYEVKPPEESLYKVEPALHFWHGTDFLAMPYDEAVVSFNLADVASNLFYDKAIVEGSDYYLKMALWDELLKRYLEELPITNQVKQQLLEQNGQPEFNPDSLGAMIS